MVVGQLKVKHRVAQNYEYGDHLDMAKLICYFRLLLLIIRGVKIDKSSVVGPQVSLGVRNFLRSSEEISILQNCKLEQGVELNPWGGSIKLGRNVFIGPYSVIYGHGGVEIGDDTLISMHCSIVSSNHAVPSSGEKIRDKSDILLATKIGRDVWLGAGVKILGGVTIGDGCVVGAGSVVTKDLPCYSVAVGVPAKIIRKR